MIIANLLARLDGVRREGDQFVARCPGPAHPDRRPSLAIRSTSDRILIHCRSQHCRPQEIVKAIGLELRDLFVEPRSAEGSARAGRRSLSPLAEARREILATARRQRWARQGVLESYRLADELRCARRRIGELRVAATGGGDTTNAWQLEDQAAYLEREVLAVETRLEECQAAETWTRGLEAVRTLLVEARQHRRWRGFSPGHGSWLTRHGVVA